MNISKNIVLLMIMILFVAGCTQVENKTNTVDSKVTTKASSEVTTVDKTTSNKLPANFDQCSLITTSEVAENCNLTSESTLKTRIINNGKGCNYEKTQIQTQTNMMIIQVNIPGDDHMLKDAKDAAAYYSPNKSENFNLGDESLFVDSYGTFMIDGKKGENYYHIGSITCEKEGLKELAKLIVERLPQ
ncbi:MAG: hypothetical protein Q7S22_07415 [Candidatus Micrarchaeota archaeon]|nr:hypothetical protein [Candidatus Micrarchaeota archaeon]